MGVCEWDIGHALFFTGPRPKNLFNNYDPMYEPNKRILLKMRDVIIDYIENSGVEVFLVGMAIGIDLWAGRMIMKLKEDDRYSHIKLVAVVPCHHHYAGWPQSSVDEWYKVFNASDYKHFVTDDEYTNGCMQKRNEWMVNHSSYGIGIVNGKPGGTLNCLKYADLIGVDVTKIHYKTLVTS